MIRFSLFLLSLVTWHLNAQVTITNATFPKSGDSLRYAIPDSLPGTFSVGNVGGPQNWDFSFLNSGQKITQAFVNPSTGKDAAAFPDANLLLKDGDQELYLKSSTSKIEALGFSGANPFFDAPLVIKYSKRPVFRAAPLTFIGSTGSSGEFRIDISTSIIPDTLLAGLPIRPDSIRIQFSNNDKGIVDGFGTLKMQGKTYNVLREKVESISDTKLFIKLFGLWIDPLPLIGGNIPGGFGGFLGQDTSYIYNFYSDTKKEILVGAQFTIDNELSSLQFADFGGVVSASEDPAIATRLQLAPNPASDYVSLYGLQLPDGMYFATVTAMNGAPVLASLTGVQQGKSAEINIQHLPPGQYVLSLRDRSNSWIASTTFLIRR